MNSTDTLDEAIATAPASDELMIWELRVAQRADELARAHTAAGRARDLACWLQAEREIFSPAEGRALAAVSVS